MKTIDEALRIVRELTPPAAAGGVERTPLAESVGRVLAADVTAGVDLPPFSRSTMDGFALRAADAREPGSSLRIVGEAAAGAPAEAAVSAGEAVRTLTGAQIPEGADCVVPVERTEESGGKVRVEVALRVGQNIARQGEDLARGELALPAGTAVATSHIGLLAALGVTELAVRPRPRVAILATGTELVDPADTPGPGQIRESNGSALAALVRQAGGVPVNLGRVADDPELIRARAEAGLECDLFLLSGGSSVGDYDYTPRVLGELGVVVHFDRVRLKPGKPTIFGTRDGTAVFGLPGNPISAFVVFHLFVRPALIRRAGSARRAPLFVEALLAESVGRNRERDQCLPALLALADGAWSVRFAGWHGSGDLTCLNAANAFMLVPHGEGQLPAGARVRVTPIDGGRLGDISFGSE